MLDDRLLSGDKLVQCCRHLYSRVFLNRYETTQYHIALLELGNYRLLIYKEAGN